MKRSRFSARKSRIFRNSPHPDSTEELVSPHRSKIGKKSIRAGNPDDEAAAIRDMRHRTIAGHGGNYEQAFVYAGDEFWENARALRNIERKELDKRKLVLGRHTLGVVRWGTQFPYSADGEPGKRPLPDRFVSAFVEAVRDRNFPKGRKAQAKFLGDSLGADGEVSARRSRDICGQERSRAQQAIPQAEFYIHCCGKKRWTVNQLCPECKRSPMERTLRSMYVLI